MSCARVSGITCKSLLSKSKIPSLQYAVNPYVGCEHGCTYCYATFMGRFRKLPGEWGSFVFVKENAPEVLAREIAVRQPGVVCLSTVCDAYQPAEATHRVTRRCLEALAGGSGFEVGVLTKSDMFVRDLDVLSRLESVDIGVTVTTVDDRVAAAFEPGAPPPRRRLEAMSRAAGEGLDVWGFFGPVLPGFSDSDDALGDVLTAFDKAGAGRVLVDSLNLYPSVLSRFGGAVAREFPDRLEALEDARADLRGYEYDLSERVRRVAGSLGVEVDLCF